MSPHIMPVLVFAAFTGIIHTLIGPDHYVPFIALSKAQSWSRKKTFCVTLLCGLGHVLSAVVIAGLALGLRFSLGALHVIESTRSDLAAWALIAFGLVYFVWSVKSLYSKKEQKQQLPTSPAVWAMFIIFVVGPCEPLFFLMTHPAVANSAMSLLAVVSVFSAATLMTMLATVMTVSFGLNSLVSKPAMKYAPAISGILIMACGIGIKFLGL